MSMEQPLDAKTVEEMRKQQLEHRKRYTVGVISPDGVVTAHVCAPGEPQHGDEPVQWINEQQMLVKRYADKGYRLLEPACIEEGCPERHARWQQVIRDRADGKRVKAAAEEIYPPSVLRQRGYPVAQKSEPKSEPKAESKSDAKAGGK